MTVNSKRIIKGLKCCGRYDCDCENCPYYRGRGEICKHAELQADALDLIMVYRRILKKMMEGRKNAVSKQIPRDSGA